LIDKPRVGLIIPTCNGGLRWQECLSAVRRQALPLRRLLVIDSASSDETPSLAREAGFEVIEIDRSQFNHGGTRQWAAEYLSDCEILVFLTQDALLADRESLGEIVNCFSDPKVALAYGRQIPHTGATPIEAHARFFNYGEHTVNKAALTAKSLGAKAYFCSNSFAAYRRSILMEVGGFRRDLILGEDMEFAARAIKCGYTNVYCATSRVRHSHDYSVRQTLSRYFDIGVFDEQNGWLRNEFGSHKGQGARFVASELRFVLRHAPLQIPRAILLTCVKFIGYRLGREQRRLPRSLKVRISMLPRYWQ
jgi:rhamnosyltransferase